MIEPKDLIDEARQLLSGARGSEVRCRTAISRAYYGGYHAFLEHATNRGYQYSKDEGRGRHAHFLKALPSLVGHDDDLLQACQDLIKLHTRRITCDYHLDDEVIHADAADSVAVAKEIVALLAET